MTLYGLTQRNTWPFTLPEQGAISDLKDWDHLGDSVLYEVSSQICHWCTARPEANPASLFWALVYGWMCTNMGITKCTLLACSKPRNASMKLLPYHPQQLLSSPWASEMPGTMAGGCPWSSCLCTSPLLELMSKSGWASVLEVILPQTQRDVG